MFRGSRVLATAVESDNLVLEAPGLIGPVTQADTGTRTRIDGTDDRGTETCARDRGLGHGAPESSESQSHGQVRVGAGAL